MVSSTYFGYGFSGLRPPASVPASFTGLGAAGIGLFPVKDSMGGSVRSLLVSLDANPSVGSGTVTVAGPLGSAGVPQGAHDMMPGACPISKTVAPPAQTVDKPVTFGSRALSFSGPLSPISIRRTSQKLVRN